VLVNRCRAGLPSVLLDAADGMRQAVEHLAALGHRRVAHLSGPVRSWSAGERLRGLREAATACGVDAVELGPFPPTFEAGLPAADLALASGATAVLAYNDLMALGVLNRLAVRGVVMPAEMSVVGFDGIQMSAMTTPALTTVAVPTETAGRAAVELLLDLLAHPERHADAARTLPSQLVVRSTTVPPLPQAVRAGVPAPLEALS
jgi:DNA-binding LacI/PurR family transcriptional regulator